MADTPKPKSPMEPVDVPMDSVAVNNYDRGIIPAETAARQEREGKNFKKTPHQIDERENYHETPDTEGGYTVDREGLLNNYPIEPEMYYETPGDAQQAHQQNVAERAEELRDVNEDKEGQLTMEEDKRGRGPGIV